MARRVERGGVWLHRFAPPDKRRPVVVISRQDVIDLISTVLVAPITSTIRDIPSEVVLDVDDRMKGPCVVQAAPRWEPHKRNGRPDLSARTLVSPFYVDPIS